MSLHRPSPPRAFTLVEMLVVLGIIGLLVALLLPAIMAAVNNARRTQIALEIKNLDMAFETYKQQRGEYPPSFGERDSGGTLVYGLTMGPVNRYNCAVERHFQNAYPKFVDIPSVSTLKANFYTSTAANIDQAEAIVLWLQATSTNAANPFDTTSTKQGYYEFDTRRLVDADGDGYHTFQARHCRDTDYIYMESRSYINYIQQNAYARSGNGNQRTLPYAATATSAVNPNKFQIICAGLDGDFGNLPSVSGTQYKPKLFPQGNTTAANDKYETGDLDNLTNFSAGKTLGDARPQ